jgi:hypothetical protein
MKTRESGRFVLLLSEASGVRIAGNFAEDAGIAESSKKIGFAGAVWLASDARATYDTLVGVAGKRNSSGPLDRSLRAVKIISLSEFRSAGKCFWPWGAVGSSTGHLAKGFGSRELLDIYRG